MGKAFNALPAKILIRFFFWTTRIRITVHFVIFVVIEIKRREKKNTKQGSKWAWKRQYKLKVDRWRSCNAQNQHDVLTHHNLAPIRTRQDVWIKVSSNYINWCHDIFFFLFFLLAKLHLHIYSFKVKILTSKVNISPIPKTLNYLIISYHYLIIF